MHGYLNAPEDTAKAIEPDGWFHTGDIGELDEVGRISITDRLKNIIVLGNGKNVSPAPMEAALSTSPLHLAGRRARRPADLHRRRSSPPTSRSSSEWAAPNGIAEMPPEQLVEEKAVQKLYRRRGQAHADGFAIYERPRRVGAAAAAPDRGGG